jgi:hypothetical protein
LWFVCQALIVAPPASDGSFVKPPSEPEAAQQWRAAADQAFSELVERVQQFQPDLLAEGGCALFGRIAGTSEHSFETDAGPMLLRFEQFAFAPSDATSLDGDWVAAVTAHGPTPGVVGPFATQFGLHLVIISNVEPAFLANGSLPDDQLLTAREAHLRGEIERAWQADQLQQTMAEIRDRQVVRLSPELERGP